MGVPPVSRYLGLAERAFNPKHIPLVTSSRRWKLGTLEASLSLTGCLDRHARVGFRAQSVNPAPFTVHVARNMCAIDREEGDDRAHCRSGVEMAIYAGMVMLSIAWLKLICVGDCRPHRSTMLYTRTTSFTCIHPSACVASLTTSRMSSDERVFEGMKGYLGDKWSLFLHKAAGLNLVMKIVLLHVCMVPFLLAGAYVYKKALSVQWGTALYRIFVILYRVPGANLLTGETQPIGRLVGNVLCVFSTFTFGLLLGTVSAEVKAELDKIALGSYPVRQTNHVVVLNWNQQTVPVLRQIARAKAKGDPFWADPAVVVMADMPKDKMETKILDLQRMEGSNLEVYTRSGTPTRMDHLRNINVQRAKAVVLMHPEDQPSEAAEMYTLQTAVALGALSKDLAHHQNVVLQMSDLRDGAISTSNLQSFSQVTLPGKQLMTMLACQCAMQPGLSTVLHTALDGSTTYMTGREVDKDWMGKTYGEVRKLIDTSGIVCGYLRPSADVMVHLNPSDKDKLEEGDKLVLLKGYGSLSHPTKVTVPRLLINDSPSETEPAVTGQLARNIIVAGCNAEDVTDYIDGFAEFCPRGSRVTFVGKEIPPEKERQTRQRNCSFSYVSCGPGLTGVEALLEADVQNADTILLGTAWNDDIDKITHDAQVVAQFMQIREALTNCRRRDPPHILLSVKSADTYLTLQQYRQNLVRHWEEGYKKQEGSSKTPVTCPVPQLEFMVPDNVISSILTKAAASPLNACALRDLLFTSRGAEVYLRDPQTLNLSANGEGEGISFGQVAENARQRKQTALGYLSRDGQCWLAPHPEDLIMLKAGDKIITLAEDF